jgi:hypothetical protein
VEARLRISGIRPATLFLPFHYGYWDTPGGHQPTEPAGRAANELTITDWDPASKQPLFKCAAARVERIAAGDAPSAAPTTAASKPVGGAVSPTRGGADAAVLERVVAEEGER